MEAFVRDVQLFIDGKWSDASGGRWQDVENPATGETVARVAMASADDLERAAKAASRGFAVWKAIPAVKRADIMHNAAALLRERAEAIAPNLTEEQGKPLANSINEARNAAAVIDWFAEEGRRVHGRTIPPRGAMITAIAAREPVGPVAGFTPWNYPIGQAVRKIAASLAAGCSIVVKAAEETPSATAAMVRCFEDAGVPPGVVNLVFGVPSQVSEYLIAHPLIRAISFTGSTAVGRELTMMAGKHLKRSTMELGGHAPFLVFADADLDDAVQTLAENKFHNAGQVCIAPTRIMVQEPVFETVLEGLVQKAKAERLGDGMDPATTMGPLAHGRRIEAVDALVQDAVAQGGRLLTGGRRAENRGHFYEPTVLADVPLTARIMNEEPFAPVAIVNRFASTDDAIAEANRLDYALAAYAFARAADTIYRLSTEVETGMISINHYDLAYPEQPFGGIKDSGFGNEGGHEALDDFLNTKFVSARII
ncbi:MAG: NAD-dependent succinate-semialdehyde dehydrogenase [Rhizobiaceae bacterium]|nr:NAD-dependent succinate-semialdehyde dehydrogenase [Rhizobiaceae bacterium]